MYIKNSLSVFEILELSKYKEKIDFINKSILPSKLFTKKKKGKEK